MKPTIKSTVGTSFHSIVVHATVRQLREVLGQPVYECNDSGDKVNFEWEMETGSGIPFTVYDWKEYRPLDEDEIIEWHIGTTTSRGSIEAANEIAEAIKSTLIMRAE
jgi:hypothetical protein